MAAATASAQSFIRQRSPLLLRHI